ncbi:MAG: 4-carboxymuconolactone decarboxylase [Verrucomicrobiota bacterium]|jgi:hypothetical protein
MNRVLFSLAFGAVAIAAFAQHDPNDIVHPANEPGYSRSAYEVGRRLAEQDIREGRLIMEVSGGLPGIYQELKRVLEERYAIHLKEIAGCVVDYEITGHERGYNEVSKAEIRRRFGRDVAEETRDELRKAQEGRIIESAQK